MIASFAIQTGKKIYEQDYSLQSAVSLVYRDLVIDKHDSIHGQQGEELKKKSIRLYLEENLESSFLHRKPPPKLQKKSNQ